MLLFLTGMPGVGKSHWLKRFAKKLNWAKKDLDKVIQEQSGQSIQELMTPDAGYFREWERKALSSVILNCQKTVVATGGGTPCFSDNLEKMKMAGKVVWLQQSLKQIKENLLNSKDVRPLLSDRENLEENLKNLYEERFPYYSQSDLYFNLEKDDFSRILNELSKIL